MTLGITPQTQISFMILVQLLHSFLLLFTCLLQLHYIQLTLMGPLRCRSPQYIFFDFIPVIPPLTRSPLIVSLFYLRSQRPFIPHHHTFFQRLCFSLWRYLHFTECFITLSSCAFPAWTWSHPLGLIMHFHHILPFLASWYFVASWAINPSGTWPRPVLAPWYKAGIALLSLLLWR